MTPGELFLLAQQHGVAGAVAAPLFGVMACLMAPGPRTALAAALMALAVAAVAAALAAVGVLAHGPLAYVLSEGLALRVDAWSALMTAAALGLGFIGFLVGGAGYLREADPGPARYGFAAALGAVAATAAAAYGGNLAFGVLALQLAGLSLAALTATAGAHRAQALNAGLRASWAGSASVCSCWGQALLIRLRPIAGLWAGRRLPGFCWCSWRSALRG